MAAADAVGAFGNLRNRGLVDTAAGVVGVVGNRLDVVVGEGIEVLARLTLIAGAGQDMIKVRDDAGGIKELAAGIEIEAPRITRAFGEDLEDVAGRMETPDARVDLHALVVGRARLADDRVGEDAVVTIEPAVGAPDKAVERLMRVLKAPAIEQHDGLTRLIVGIFRDEEEFRGRADPHAAVTDFDARDEIESFLEDRDLRIGTVLLHVFQNQNAIGTGAVGALLRIGHPFHDPEAAAFVEAHRDRLDDLRLARDERDLETFR